MAQPVIADARRLDMHAPLLSPNRRISLPSVPLEVRLHGCRLGAMTFDMTLENLLPETDGIIDPGDFPRTIAMRAEHCQYF
jgi:hypothetical protein